MSKSLACAVCLAFVALSPSAARADVTLLGDVPSYEWYHGCGPAATGMIMGYWDARGFDDLIDGSNDWLANQQAVKEMIASPGHIRDYVPTPDRAASPNDPLHENDCVADFMGSSMDPAPYGVSYETWQYAGMAGYAASKGYTNDGGEPVVYFGGLWTLLAAEIDAGRPLEFFVDSTADGTPDHFVTAIGYDDTPGALRYACYNTYDHDVHWYDFAAPAVGLDYGVRLGVSFRLAAAGDFNQDGQIDAADADLLYDQLQTSAPPTDDKFDLIADQTIDVADMTELVTGIIQTSMADNTLDGLVNIFDLTSLANRYGQTGRFSDGDSDCNGFIDIFDLGNLAADFSYSVVGNSAASPPVPEPGSLVLLAMGAVTVSSRRRR